jgi:hypothetical protein
MAELFDCDVSWIVGRLIIADSPLGSTQRSSTKRLCDARHTEVLWMRITLNS